MAKKQKVAVVDGILTVEYPTLGKKFVADLTKYSDGIRQQAMDHGFKQKFGDAASGKTATEKYEMVQRIHAGLLEDQWELTSTPDMSGIVVEAVCRLKKLKEAAVRAAIEKNEGKLKEWSANASVKAEIAKIRAERAAKAAEEADDIEINL